jgi:dUTP pyrophosphatase
MDVLVKELISTAIVPEYQTEGAAGFDLHSAGTYLIGPRERILVGTGLAFEIPKGYEMQIRPRSGLAAKSGITVLNSPGTIDSDYRGEVGIIIINHGNCNFIVNTGDRIAQGVIAQVEQATFKIVKNLSDTTRGEGGFGSTNKEKA